MDINNDSIETNLKDRIKGMFAGLMLGDALGAPHEFWKWNRNTVYTGKLEIKPFRMKDPRFAKGNREVYGEIGSVTDDTQMTLALLISILDNSSYDKEKTIKAYADWAHSGAKDMGKNTRYLFTNKTVKGYYSRVKKRDDEIEKGTLK